MKKYILPGLVFILLCNVSSLLGQRVNLSDFEVNARYITPPKIGFDSTISVYHVEVIGDESKLAYINRSSASIKKRIKINGYTKVNEEIGPKIEITFFGPTNSKGQLKKNNREDRDGKKYTLFSYEYVFNASADVRILDEEGLVLKEFKESSKESSSSKAKRSLKAAKSEIKRSGRNITISGRKKALEGVIKAINRTLNVEWGLRPTTVEVEFEFPKKEKHHHFKKWNPYKENVKAAFSQMSVASNDNFMENIQPAIDFWVKMAPTYPQDDRKLRKMNFACLYNTALAYFWAEDFENARLYAQKVSEGDYRDGKGRRLMDDIEELEKAIAKAGIPSLHFTIDVPDEIQQQIDAKKAAREAAIAAGDITQHEDFGTKLSVRPSSSVIPGRLHFKTGTQTNGFFVFEADGDMPDFREPTKIRFGFMGEDGEIKSTTMSYALYNGFELDGKWYMIDEDFQLETGLIDLQMKNAIIYKGSDFEKTYMGIVYPPFKFAKILNKTEELHPEMFVFNKSNEECIPIRPTILLSFAKTIKKITGENCAEVSAYLENYKERQPDASQIETDEKRFRYAPHTYEVLKLYDACESSAEIEEGR